MDHLSYVLRFALSHPWAIERGALQVIAGVLARHIAGLEVDHHALNAAVEQNKRRELPQPRKGGAVALIPIHGPIVPRATMMTEVSGLASTEGITAAVNDAIADPNIRQIVLDIDSPGGNVAGCTECVESILAAREQKPIVAQAHFSMGSAAYWIGSAATEIVASPSAQVGSIGVFAIHNDISEALKALGIKRTYISEGKYKLIGKETEALSDDDRAEIAGKVKEFYGTFVDDVARGRKVPASSVRNGYGEGRIVGASEALNLKMVDRVATLSETLARLSPGSAPTTIAAAVDTPELRAADFAWQNDAFRALQELNL